MTREDIRTRALLALNDSPTAPRFWTIDELGQVIDECQEVLADETEALQRTVYVPMRPGIMHYPLRGFGPRAMTPWRLWTRQRQHRLWPTSMTELDGHYERWLEVQGDPEWWFLLSWDLLGVWPVPASGGGVLEVECLVWPAPLIHDDASPAFPDAQHETLVESVVVEGQLKQWDVARALELALPLQARYKDARAASGLRRVQERFFGAELPGGDLRA